MSAPAPAEVPEADIRAAGPVPWERRPARRGKMHCRQSAPRQRGLDAQTTVYRLQRPRPYQPPPNRTSTTRMMMRSVRVSMLPSLSTSAKQDILLSKCQEKFRQRASLPLREWGWEFIGAATAKPTQCCYNQAIHFTFGAWLSHPTSSLPFHRQTDFWEQVRRTQLRE